MQVTCWVNRLEADRLDHHARIGGLQGDAMRARWQIYRHGQRNPVIENSLRPIPVTSLAWRCQPVRDTIYSNGQAQRIAFPVGIGRQYVDKSAPFPGR